MNKILVATLYIFVLCGCISNEIKTSSERFPKSILQYGCYEFGHSKKSIPIHVTFNFIKPDEISDLKVKLNLTKEENEVFSSDNKSLQAITESKNSDLLKFSITEENKDSFDLSFDKNNYEKQQFYATADITFDEDASKTIKLYCKLN